MYFSKSKIVVASALVVAGATGIGTAVASDQPGIGPGVPAVHTAPLQSTSAVGAPTVLPAIASLKGSWTLSGGQVHHEYRLAGSANSDTATAEALERNPESRAVHPATYLTVDFIPQVGDLQIPADPAYNNITTVDVNGAEGKLTIAKNGLGVIRLDWIDAQGNYHVVMSERLDTSDGVSGLAADQILAVGRSVK